MKYYYLFEMALACPGSSYTFAKDFLKGHDERLLEAVCPNPYVSYIYAKDVLKGHDKRLFEAVLPDFECCYDYTRNVFYKYDKESLLKLFSQKKKLRYFEVIFEILCRRFAAEISQFEDLYPKEFVAQFREIMCVKNIYL
ncbi:MAG: hypothetical protein ACTSYI_12295 [Promethearchaeota archaeon]